MQIMSNADLASKFRARQMLNEILEAHRAAVESIRIVSRSDGFPDRLVVAMQTYYGFDPQKREECERRVLINIDRTKKFEWEDFFYQRKMLLISLCGLLDIATKDVVAEKLANEEHLRKGLPKKVQTAIESICGNVSTESTMEGIFNIVDHHFRTIDETRKLLHAGRFRYWLQLVDEEPPRDDDGDFIINQVINIRNWAVHRSESASRMLADTPFWDQDRGEPRLGQEESTRFVNSIRKFIEGIGCGDL